LATQEEAAVIKAAQALGGLFDGAGYLQGGMPALALADGVDLEAAYEATVVLNAALIALTDGAMQQEFWRAVLEDATLSDAHKIELLAQACEHADLRIALLEQQLADRRTERGIWRDEEPGEYLAGLAGGGPTWHE
jgi:hypothetical protein